MFKNNSKQLVGKNIKNYFNNLGLAFKLLFFSPFLVMKIWKLLRTFVYTVKVFESFLFSTLRVRPRKKNYIVIKLIDERSFNSSLLFVLIKQITVMFFSYTTKSYNIMASEIRTKDNLWRKVLGKILKEIFVTVEI